MYPLTFICIISLLWNHSLSTELKDSVENSPQQRLLGALLKNYDSDALPLSAKSQAVTVSFGAKLVRIIELHERGNTIRSQWSIYQEWLNSDLGWNETEYNVSSVHVSPARIWVPDIILYNNADDNGKLGGGTEKYKTKIVINSSGYCNWMAPAIFQSSCDVNTEYFPFDDQICSLRFGSWAFDGGELDMVVDHSETGVKKETYQNNTEWEMMKVTVERKEQWYSCCIHPYPNVVLSLHLRRRYYFYMVNLVVPCSLIALMVLLSFILPPESGERIGLGITVLMAMAIFQELTSNKLPADSNYIPLLAKYYSTAITEIGLALFATCVILNFYYKQDTMPDWLKLFMFRILGRLVLVKYEFKAKKKKKRNRKELLIEENCELSQLTGNQYLGPYDEGKMSTINENNCEENGSYTEPEQRPPVQRKRTRTRSLIRAETPLLNDRVANSHHHEHCILEPDHEKQDDELNNNRADWKMAAKILDRLVLVLGIVMSIATFLAIFLPAPRVRAIFL